MWEVYEHRRVAKQLQRLPLEILKRYEKWKDIVVISGPQALRAIRGLRDEALQGEWLGHRSSRLSAKYRVIYRIENSEFIVLVIDISAHDYRKK